MSTTDPPSRIDLLPVELVSIIIDNIGHDLLTHTAFRELSDFVAGCYDGRGAKFWEPILRASGIGCLNDETLTDEEWGQLAIECVEHAEECEHPACGLDRLEDNINRMEAAQDDDEEPIRAFFASYTPVSEEPEWDIMDVSSSENKWYGEQEPLEDIWEFIAFKTERVTKKSKYVNDTVHLRSITSYEMDTEPVFLKDPLKNHPVALRSFATFLPVARLKIPAIPNLVVENKRGITVGDVANAIMDRFDDELKDSTLDNLFRTHILRKHGAFPDSWSQKARDRALVTVRDWFKLTHWEKLTKIDVKKDCVLAEMWFIGVDLPESRKQVKYEEGAPVYRDE